MRSLQENRIYRTADFRTFLQTELVRRMKENPRYSLRAFARTLRVDPSLLSKILSGKRTISRTLCARLTERLGLTPNEGRHLWLTETFGKEEMEPQESYRTLTVDHFHLISDWYHYAIYELLKVRRFQPSVRWVASALGISIAETKDALERLVRLGFIEMDSKGKWSRTKDNITTVGNNFTAAAFRKLQRQILEMGVRALEEIPWELRDQTSMTMAIDSRFLPQAKKRIAEFRRSLCRELQKSGNLDQVYQLSVALYPVTDLKKGKEQ